MSSIRNQVVTRIVAALIGQTAAGNRVFRSREDAINLAESPCIVVTPDSEESEAFGGGNVDQNTFIVTIEISTRGDPWDADADLIAVPVHRTVMRDAELLALVTHIRSVSSTWQGKEADQTAGNLATKYRVRYLSPSDDIATAL